MEHSVGSLPSLPSTYARSGLLPERESVLTAAYGCKNSHIHKKVKKKKNFSRHSGFSQISVLPCDQKQKTRIHHQHLCLGEELPGLRDKGMEKFEFSKRFFEKEFSEARMKPYFERYRGNELMAIDLYEKNIRLSESLLPSISVFEVAVRNAIISELERMTGNKEWYEFFRLHPELKIPYNYIEKSIRHISARGELCFPDLG